MLKPLLISLMLVTPVVSQPVEVVADKLTAEDPETLDVGQKELEFFFLHSRSITTPDEHTRTSEFLTGSFGYGVAENFDFSLVASGSSILDLFGRDPSLAGGIGSGPARGGGLTNLGLQFRWKFAEDKDEDWALATVMGTSLRNNFQFAEEDADVKGTGNFQTFDVSLVARKNWGRLTSDVEVFYSVPLPTHNQGRFSQIGSNLALGYQLDDWIQPSIELNYLHVSP